MKKNNKQNFVQVNYNLLATTKLNSTQKLFISYIIGWQRNKLFCKETNNNLALKFGMKYGGIRSLLSSLNKFDFFKSESFDYDKTTSTSGHQITVDIGKLGEFLSPEKTSQETDSKEPERIEDVSQDNSKTTMQYHDDEIINIEEVMTILDFNIDDINSFRNLFSSNNVKFGEFQYTFSGRYGVQKYMPDDGIAISSEQYEKFLEMCFED
ncbi:hypothetical protein GGR22_000708 [Flavobacterium gossypii]|uniref:Transcriptional regulator n=1 Tax=Flavobacterium gossypii TaxID=1646119 RepID=A0ABR6DLM0_9FLAO|nr:hypothetical protein [Flavobacterium gossypii]MBA9072582.1 hypothetical protein [Flavobacterium gossypii]